MKFGLLTYHSAANFGANLQALSTVAHLTSLNHEVLVINWVPIDLELYYKNNVSYEQCEKHREFISKYLNISELCRTSDDVRKVVLDNSIDCIIVGSDAVFSYIPFVKRIHPSRKTLIGIRRVTSDHKFPNPFWGDFVFDDDKFKLVAMSASAQYFDFRRCFPWVKRSIQRSLKRFDYITVRDRETKRIVDSLLDSNVSITPDPVFAFNDNFKQDIKAEEFRRIYNLPEKYVILSFCKLLYSSMWYDDLYHKFKLNGYTVVNLAMPEGCIDYRSDIKINVPLDPLDWYNIIRFSSGYIGQRMHPMIVALHNSVPVYIFDHYVVNTPETSKIYDLLERFQLLDNYVCINSKKVPSPDSIYNSIVKFNHIKLTDNLLLMKDRYFTMMNNIINL